MVDVSVRIVAIGSVGHASMEASYMADVCDGCEPEPSASCEALSYVSSNLSRARPHRP